MQIYREKRTVIEKELIENISWDYPTFVYNNYEIGNNRRVESFFVLPVSGLLGRVTLKAGKEKVFSPRELYIAFPRDEGVFKKTFYEELRQSILTGNTGILNERTLKETDFLFTPVEVVIERQIRNLIPELKEEIEDLSVLSDKEAPAVREVVLIG